MKTTQVEYTKDFQVKLLAHLVHDEEFFVRARAHLQDTDFDLPACRAIYLALCGYYAKVGAKPTVTGLETELLGIVQAGLVIDFTEHESLADVWQTLWPGRTPELDSKYMDTQLIPFIKQMRLRKLTNAYMAGSGFGETVDPNKYVADIARLSEVGRVDRGIMSSGTADFEPVLTGMAARSVSTGLIRLDGMIGGPVLPGKLVMVTAPPGVGKTNTACNVSFGGVVAGHEALLMTLEMSATRIKARFVGIAAHVAAGLFRKPVRDWEDARARERVEYLQRSAIRDRLTVADLSTQRVVLADVETCIREWKRQGDPSRRNLVCIDWLDYIKHAEAYGERGLGDDDPKVLTAVCRELGKLARKYDVVIWTATQGTRDSIGVTIMSQKHTAGAFHKNDACDIALGLSESAEDKLKAMRRNEQLPDGEMAECRRTLHITTAKNRDASDSTMRIFQGPSLRYFNSETEYNRINALVDTMSPAEALGY